MDEGGNLLQSMLVLRRLKEEEKRQARLAYKRALAAKKQKEKDDKFRYSTLNTRRHEKIINVTKCIIH